MAEYIGCRNCSSPDCKGCNIYTLAKMLNAGKFDCLMNGNRSINPFADVVEVVHGLWEWREEWETHPETHSCDLISCGWYCTECGIELGDYLTEKIGQHIILDDDFRKPKLTRCPKCGARMDGESDGTAQV